MALPVQIQAPAALVGTRGAQDTELAAGIQWSARPRRGLDSAHSLSCAQEDRQTDAGLTHLQAQRPCHLVHTKDI